MYLSHCYLANNLTSLDRSVCWKTNITVISLFGFICFLEVVVLWVEGKKKTIFMKLIASLAPARAEIEAEVVAKI
jgi:hypothetical protein